MTNELIEFEKLERALLRAGREMEYPATPAIAARVRDELLQAPTAPARNWQRLLVPIAVAIVLALVLLLALPTARDAVGQFLGLRGLQIFYLTPTPEPTKTHTPAPTLAGMAATRTAPAATPRPTMTRSLNPVEQCCETTLEEAVRRASFDLLLPPGQMPSRVFYQRIFEDGEQVIMVFGDPENPEFTLYQAHRWVYGKIIAKGLTGQTTLDETEVNGERALWFSGAPHVLVTMDRLGRQNFDVARTVDANTLVWETGDLDRGVIYRVETRATLQEARDFAQALVEVSE